jgi:hypothetical protein
MGGNNLRTVPGPLFPAGVEGSARIQLVTDERHGIQSRGEDADARSHPLRLPCQR